MRRQFSIKARLARYLNNTIGLTLVRVGTASRHRGNAILQVSQRRHQIRFQRLYRPPYVTGLAGPSLLAHLRGVNRFAQHQSLLDVQAMEAHPTGTFRARYSNQPIHRRHHHLLEVNTNSYNERRQAVN